MNKQNKKQLEKRLISNSVSDINDLLKDIAHLPEHRMLSPEMFTNSDAACSVCTTIHNVLEQLQDATDDEPAIKQIAYTVPPCFQHRTDNVDINILKDVIVNLVIKLHKNNKL